ncbi:dynamin family protein [Amycolatopsis silviterrae]|uniref:Dynamin family protein n=1 Tax=Amycolatopsis silviterrae TaxID=1656914 RepID=A0ABW5HP58_9PSEU
MDVLRDYQSLRLELADLLRAALHLARARGDQERESRARALLARLAEDEFRLAVVGRYSQVKTTLMNALLGDQYLPTGTQPTTSVLTSVRYGTRPLARVRRRGAVLPIEVPLADVGQFVRQDSAERAESQVESVDIEVPAELLRLGCAFVDTPGLGSSLGLNTMTTQRFLPDADALVFVTASDASLAAFGTEFLAGTDVPLFVAVTKRDLVSEKAAAAILPDRTGTLPSAGPSERLRLAPRPKCRKLAASASAPGGGARRTRTAAARCQQSLSERMIATITHRQGDRTCNS